MIQIAFTCINTLSKRLVFIIMSVIIVRKFILVFGSNGGQVSGYYL